MLPLEKRGVDMSHPMVTYADALAAIGTLPSLAPRPCSTNIRALTVDLIDKLTIIPSEQSADLGYSGLAEQDAVYALQTNVPWTDWIIRARFLRLTPHGRRSKVERQGRSTQRTNCAGIWNRTSDERSMQRSTQPSRAHFAGYQEAGWGFESSARPTTQKSS